MLLAMLPSQVASNWEKIKGHIHKNAPVMTSDGYVDYNKVLEAILGGRMQLWASSPDGATVNGFCITEVQYNYFSGKRSLHLYAIFGRPDRRITRQEWLDAYETIRAFAKAKGCERITGFSNHPSLVKLAERLGLDTSWRFISVEV